MTGLLDKPRVLWCLLAAASGVVLAALALVTQQALRAERGEREAQAIARFEESIRTALWRLDSEMTPILAREAGRPYYEYRSFIPADVLTQRNEPTAGGRPLLVPSPLLETRDPFIYLHFEQRGGRITSPKLPEGEELGQARDIYTSAYDLANTEEALRQLTGLFEQPADPAPLAHTEQMPDAESTIPEKSDPEVSERPLPSGAEKEKSDYLQRQDVLQKAQSRTIASNTAAAPRSAAQPARAGVAPERANDVRTTRERADSIALATVLSSDAAQQPASASPVRTGALTHGKFTPEWIIRKGASEPVLLYRRTVVLDGEEIRQGFWIDWPALRASLLEAVRDLFPQAKLTPVTSEPGGQIPQVLSRMMATVPAMLEVPAPPTPAPPPWSPVRSILLASWLVALLALGGLALIVRAAAELAARRGKFVSAVSHELRTPLTTLSMYSQMLAEGMVTGQDAQRTYARTLHEQSTRLSRIVESVLDFARLGRVEPTPVGAVALSAVAERVDAVAHELCRKADRALSHDRAGTADVRVRADPAVVERIVANLVENACKYGAGTITMRWSVSQSQPRSAQLLISDDGPGVPQRESRRIFRAFERGSAHAHGSTPGLGLGLAVSRALARRAGGDLRHIQGSQFALTLPIASG